MPDSTTAPEARPGRGPGPLTTYLLIALLCLIWGSTWLVIKEGLRDLPPFTSCAVRFTLASAVFALLAGWLYRREGGARPGWRLSAVQGVFSFAIPYGVVYASETVLPSSLASVLWAVFPILVAITGHFVLPGERLGPRDWGGFGVGFLGVVLLFVTDLRAIGPGALAVGAAYFLSPLASAVGNTLVKRDGGHVSSALLNRNGMVLGALLMWGVALALERDRESNWSGFALFSVTYLALVGTVVAFGLYFWLLRWAPAYKLSLIAYVIPGVALALGWSLGDEAVGLHTLLGAGLILGGVGVVARGGPSRPATSGNEAAREEGDG